jgi:hypothetical protein
MFHEPLSRSETVKFKVTLNREGVERHAETLKILGFTYLVDSLQEGDTGYADYSINIQYFGDIVRKLELFATLVEDYRLVVTTDFEEMKHGRSIILDLAKQIGRIQDKLTLRRFIDDIHADAPLALPAPEPEPEPEPELPVAVLEPPAPVSEWRGFFAFLRDYFC